MLIWTFCCQSSRSLPVLNPSMKAIGWIRFFYTVSFKNSFESLLALCCFVIYIFINFMNLPSQINQHFYTVNEVARTSLEKKSREKRKTEVTNKLMLELEQGVKQGTWPVAWIILDTSYFFCKFFSNCALFLRLSLWCQIIKSIIFFYLFRFLLFHPHHFLSYFFPKTGVSLHLLSVTNRLIILI